MQITTRNAGLVAIVLLATAAGACGGGNSGKSTRAEPPIPGTPCSRRDVVVHLDATNTDARCAANASGALAWVEEKPSGSNRSDAVNGLKSSADIPAIMETVGFDLAPYNPATGMAGAFKIAGVTPPKLPSSDPNAAAVDARNEYLFLPFGYDEGNETDPQWAFYLPLGTPVISLISGTVCDVPRLYSNDFSVRVAPDGVPCTQPGRAVVLFETEHVIEPLVKFGDRVTAGQRVATVSDYDRSWKGIGLGIVEVGVAYNLGSDGSPWHACPSRFLTPNAKPQTLAALKSVMNAWSANIGKSELYAAANTPEPGCFMADVHN